ncbi:hypothetical protein [Chitinimonas sp. BJB300]|uniref:hypothetical protein n=1 Tax=Chitinimonas sp. BJB300 TaxID=1559339 RepID=UPI000C0CA1C5|nr:hypothetical protein [Chitinimonas sp. BJB300]PHV11110.1 hypothetical protein CSQ89_12595 [Chitinimonas sp. BJB300]TSJ88130.1 hypothetical protein FG002_011445 [Chitinimonas sp. BJB300]
MSIPRVFSTPDCQRAADYRQVLRTYVKVGANQYAAAKIIERFQFKFSGFQAAGLLIVMHTIYASETTLLKIQYCRTGTALMHNRGPFAKFTDS